MGYVVSLQGRTIHAWSDPLCFFSRFSSVQMKFTAVALLGGVATASAFIPMAPLPHKTVSKPWTSVSTKSQARASGPWLSRLMAKLGVDEPVSPTLTALERRPTDVQG